MKKDEDESTTGNDDAMPEILEKQIADLAKKYPTSIEVDKLGQLTDAGMQAMAQFMKMTTRGHLIKTLEDVIADHAIELNIDEPEEKHLQRLSIMTACVSCLGSLEGRSHGYVWMKDNQKREHFSMSPDAVVAERT